MVYSGFLEKPKSITFFLKSRKTLFIYTALHFQVQDHHPRLEDT